MKQEMFTYHTATTKGELFQNAVFILIDKGYWIDSATGSSAGDNNYTIIAHKTP